MNILLTKLLNKRGMKREELDQSPVVPGFPSEKQQFEKWESVLSGEGMTLEKIESFCRAQVEGIETQWKNLDNASLKNERLIIAHTIYSTLLKTIKVPEVEREELEKVSIGKAHEPVMQHTDLVSSESLGQLGDRITKEKVERDVSKKV